MGGGSKSGNASAAAHAEAVNAAKFTDSFLKISQENASINAKNSILSKLLEDFQQLCLNLTEEWKKSQQEQRPEEQLLPEK